MAQFQRKKWFTLVEVLISTIIIWLLFMLIFKVFDTLSDISVRVEGERQMQNELLYITETLQTLADNYNIDYDTYRADGDIDLFGQQGMVHELHLINAEAETVTIATSWDCYQGDIETPDHIQHMRSTDCILTLEKGDHITQLTDPNIVDMSHVAFKLVPYDSNERLLYSGSADNPYERIQYPWFWLFARMYHKIFGKDRTTNVKQGIHQYFTVYDNFKL